MRCQECGVELMIYRVTVDVEGGHAAEYVCRNKRCSAFDRRLRKTAAQPSTEGESTETTQIAP